MAVGAWLGLEGSVGAGPWTFLVGPVLALVGASFGTVLGLSAGRLAAAFVRRAPANLEESRGFVLAVGVGLAVLIGIALVRGPALYAVFSSLP